MSARIRTLAVLVRLLVQRELKARYRGTALGFLWTFVNPLLLIATYTLVFSVFNRSGVASYPYFVLCGLFPWLCFSSTMLSSCTAVIDKEEWIKHMAFPTHILPAVAVITEFVHLLLSLPLLLFLLSRCGIHPGFHVFLLGPVFAVQLALSLGLAWIFSALQAAYRDVLFMLSNLMTLWFFLTPVVYASEQVPVGYRFLVRLNPMAYVVKAFQDILFFGRVPQWGELLTAGAQAALILAAGYAFFDARRHRFAEGI